MTSILCAALVQSALMLGATDATPAGAETYASAHRAAMKTGKPIVVMVSTDWCVPCQAMKKRVLPKFRERRGLFRRVSFAMVNPDQDAELAEQITGGGPVPQLVMYRKTGKGWMRRKLIGGQSVEDVEKFIKDGLAADESEKKAAAKDRGKSDKSETRHASADKPTRKGESQEG